MKGTLVFYSIKQQQNELCKKSKKINQKNLDNLVINNHTITNLSDIKLNDGEIAVLKLGLKHGFLIGPNEKHFQKILKQKKIIGKLYW